MASENRFVSSNIYPDINSCEAYTEECESVFFLSKLFQILMSYFLIELMKSMSNLCVVTFDYIMAKDDQVALRYLVEGRMKL